MKLKEKLKPYEVKSRQNYTVARTETIAYIYEVKAGTEEQAIDFIKEWSIDIKPDRKVTTDIVYQII